MTIDREIRNENCLSGFSTFYIRRSIEVESTTLLEISQICLWSRTRYIQIGKDIQNVFQENRAT